VPEATIAGRPSGRADDHVITHTDGPGDVPCQTVTVVREAARQTPRQARSRVACASLPGMAAALFVRYLGGMSEPVPVQDAGASGERVRRVDARRNLEAIIDASVPLLCEHPRASMQQIAAAAGLHRATVHRHFPSRDDLLDELRRRAFASSVEELNAVLAQPSAEPGDTLERATVALITVGDRYRLYRYTTWRNAENEDRAQEIGVNLIALLTDAQAAGQVRSDLPIKQLTAAIGGLIWAMLPQVADDGLAIKQAARTIRTLIAAPTA
jgi:AcrR family transcriptional regulator